MLDVIENGTFIYFKPANNCGLFSMDMLKRTSELAIEIGLLFGFDNKGLSFMAYDVTRVLPGNTIGYFISKLRNIFSEIELSISAKDILVTVPIDKDVSKY